jgi:hypothetical protein
MEIDAIIGATQVQSHVKLRRVEEIERVLAAEVPLERPEEFVEASMNKREFASIS